MPTPDFTQFLRDAGLILPSLSSVERKRIENALYHAYKDGYDEGFTKGYSEGYGTLSPTVTSLWGAEQHATVKCNCGYGGFHEPLNPRCNLYTGAE